MRNATDTASSQILTYSPFISFSSRAMPCVSFPDILTTLLQALSKPRGLWRELKYSFLSDASKAAQQYSAIINRREGETSHNQGRVGFRLTKGPRFVSLGHVRTDLGAHLLWSLSPGLAAAWISTSTLPLRTILQWVTFWPYPSLTGATAHTLCLLTCLSIDRELELGRHLFVGAVTSEVSCAVWATLEAKVSMSPDPNHHSSLH